MSLVDQLAQFLRQADGGEFWLAAIIAGLLGAGACWRAMQLLRHVRIIEDTPTALVRSAPQGYIELRGMAEFIEGDPIHAPLSLRHCVWYRYKVEHLDRSGGSRRHSWVTIDHGVSEHLFYLTDTSGRCAIDPDGAKVRPSHHCVWYGNARIPGRYHPSDGVWWARALGRLGSSYRYSESCIEPGEQLYAIGDFTTHVGGGAASIDPDAAVAERLREWKRDQASLGRRFDANRDGRVDPEEWSTARASAREEVIAEQLQGRGPPPVDVLGRTRDRHRPFVIVAGTEDTIIRHSKRVATALLAVGIPLVCAASWAIGVRFGAS